MEDIRPRHGIKLSPDEAETALEAALEIILSVGYAQNYEKHDDAKAWIKRYFPCESTD